MNSHRPAFYKCCTISMLNENGSVLHTETHMHGHGSNRLSCDSATVTVIVKHSMLADRHDNTVEGLFCSSSRTQLNTTKNLPMKWIPQKKKTTQYPDSHDVENCVISSIQFQCNEIYTVNNYHRITDLIKRLMRMDRTSGLEHSD